MTEPAGPDLPELPLFDAAATRSAVFRGLLRTALIALAIFVVFQALGQSVGRVSFRVHDGNDHFDRVLVQGWAVGHPGVAATNGHGIASPTFGLLHATEELTFGQADGRTAHVSVRQDLLGHVTVQGDVGSRLDQVLVDGRASRAQAMTFVKGLPSAALTRIVLVLRTPLTESAAQDFEQRADVRSMAWFYDDPFTGARTGFRSQSGWSYTGAGRNPITWQTSGALGFRGGFSDWTAELSARDDANLGRLGLPSSSELKQLGIAAQVHGFLISDLTPAQLLALLNDPVVASFTPVDVRFDILIKDQIS